MVVAQRGFSGPFWYLDPLLRPTATLYTPFLEERPGAHKHRNNERMQGGGRGRGDANEGYHDE